MKIAFVTSFSDDGYKQYGKRFLESYARHCDKPLHVVYETTPDIMPQGPFIWSELDCMWMMDDFAKLPAANGVMGKPDGQIVIDYRWQATKFCKKVLALTQDIPRVDWWVWIDADVEVIADLDQQFFDTVFPNGMLWSCLQRRDMHPECGFVGYRVGHPTPRAFLHEFRDLYTSGKVFSLPEWHDSYVFNALLVGAYQPWRGFAFNLAAGAEEEMHPWPHTILGKYMVHHKGPVAKQKAYA